MSEEFLRLRKGRTGPVQDGVPVGVGSLFDALLEGVAEVQALYVGRLFVRRFEWVAESEDGGTVDFGRLFWTRVEGVARIEHGCAVGLASHVGARLGGVAQIPGVCRKGRVGAQTEGRVSLPRRRRRGEPFKPTLAGGVIGLPIERLILGLELLPLRQRALVGFGDAHTRL
jgi:hypothetical protein